MRVLIKVASASELYPRTKYQYAMLRKLIYFYIKVQTNVKYGSVRSATFSVFIILIVYLGVL